MCSTSLSLPKLQAGRLQIFLTRVLRFGGNFHVFGYTIVTAALIQGLLVSQFVKYPIGVGAALRSCQPLPIVALPGS